MNKRISLVLLVALILIAAGCTSSSKPPGSDVTTPFIGGVIGLDETFVDSAPPKEVFDGGDFPFDVEVDLKNVGEAFVSKNDVQVKISGIDPTQFGKTAADFAKNPDDDLEATKKDPDGAIIEGTETFVTFDNLNHQGQLSGNTPFTVHADVCYKYETIVNAKACIKQDLLDTTNKDVCIVSEEKKAYNSGAPVAVTSFKEQASGKDKVSYIFSVEHIGTGSVFKLGQHCDDSARANEDKVKVSVDSGIQGLSCSGLDEGTATSGYVSLHSGKRTIRCTQDLSGDRTDFEKVVVINLDYDYQDTVAADVLVKHSGD